MSRRRWLGHRAVPGNAVIVCVALAAGCGGEAGGIAAPAPPAMSADARAARAAALRFDSLLTHAPAGPAEDAVRGDWLAAALTATAYGAAPRPVTVVINGTARPSFEAVAFNRVVRSSEGADVDSMLVVLAWRGDAVSEAILLQWHGTVTSGPLDPLLAVYHPRGTYQLGADQATLGPWVAAPAAAADGGAAPCATTRTSGVDPLGVCRAGTLSLGATTFRAPGTAPIGQRPDTFVVVLSGLPSRLSAPRIVQ